MRDLEGRASGPDLEASRCGGVLVSLGGSPRWIWILDCGNITGALIDLT